MTSASPNRLPGWSFPLQLAVLAAAALWVFGAGFPSGNNVYHLPVVLDYAGSAEGPHDAFHQSLDAFVSLFWSGVALVASEANLRPLFLALLLAATVGTVLGAYAAARAADATPGRAAAALSLLSFGFVTRGVLEFGGGELLSPSLTHSQVATALCLAAAALAIRGRWLAAALLCGVAADVNLFLGFWTVMALAFARLLGDLDRDGRVGWAGLAGMALVCAVATAPAIYWALDTLQPGAPPVPYREFLEDYHPYHFFAHHEAWLFAAQIGLLGVTALALRRAAASAGQRRLGDLLFGSAIALSIGTLSGYVTDHPLVLNLHPLRFAAIAYWLAALGAIALWSRREGADDPRPDWRGVAVVGFLLPSPALTLAALGLTLDLPRLARWQRAAFVVAFAAAWMVDSSSEGRFDFPMWLRIGPVPVAALVAALCGLLLRFPKLRPGHGAFPALALAGLVIATRILDQPLLAAAGLPIALALVWQIPGTGAGHRLAWLVAAAVIVTALGLLVQPDALTRTVLLLAILLAAALVASWAPEPLRPVWDVAVAIAAVVLAVAGLATTPPRGFDFRRWDKDEAWLEAQAWARATSPPGTVFYAPDRFGFAALSRRPVWWDHNQGAAVMWSPAYFAEWSSRRELAVGATDLPALARLAREQRFRYLVRECREFEGDASMEFVIRYRNAVYCIAEPAEDPTAAASDATTGPSQDPVPAIRPATQAASRAGRVA